MKSDFLRKTVTSVCVAALLSMAAPAIADDSSIEINLDVLNHPSKQATAPASATPKETPKKTVKKTAKPKAAKPKAAKPAKTKHVAKTKTAPLPGAAPVTPVTAVPSIENNMPVTPPAVKGLPPELTPSPAPGLPVVPVETPKTETPKAEAPKAESPKSSAADQLSNFVNGTPPAAPPALAPASIPPAPGATEMPPALPANNLPTPPELPAVIAPAPPAGAAPVMPPATPGTPAAVVPPETLPAAPNAMGSPLPDSKLEPLPATPAATSATPAAPLPTPKDSPALNIEAVPALPAAIPPAPPATAPGAPVGSVTPPALPQGVPSLLPSEAPKGASAVDVPALPLPDKGAADSGLPSPPPPLSGAAPTAPAELPKAGEPQLPAKTADVPDLAPVPDNMKGDLPSLPSGRQQDLMDTSHAPASSANSTDSPPTGLESKANASDPDERLVFNETETDVPPSLNGQLDTLAAKLTQNPTAHVNIFAYAGNKSETGIYPKRVSLARGIAVRNYLTTNKGIDIERVNVRALGNKSEGGPPERVDLFITK